MSPGPGGSRATGPSASTRSTSGDCGSRPSDSPVSCAAILGKRARRNVFTGLVQEVGRIRAVEDRSGDQRFELEFGSLARERLQPGASVSVNGVCLTVVTLGA